MSSIRKTIRTMGKLCVSAVAGLQIINMKIRKNTDAQNALSKEKGSYFRAGNCDIFYKEVSGNHEEALLLLHDPDPSCSGSEFNELVSRLKSAYDIFIPDLPGCGRSEKPNITYTNYFYVQVLNEFIRDRINRPVRIVASGLAGSFAVTTASCYPDLVRSVTMINPVSLKQLASVPDRKSKILQSVLAMPVIGTSIYNIIYAEKNIEYRLNEKTFYNPVMIRKKTCERKYRCAHLGNGKYLLASLDGKYLNWNINRQLRDLSVPVSVLYGQDTKNGAFIAKQYKKLNNRILAESIPCVKYQPHLEAPELLTEYILNDLQKMK